VIDYVAEKSDLALCVAPQTSSAWKLAYTLSPNCVGTSMEQPRIVEGDLRIGWFTRLDTPKRPDIWFEIIENLDFKGLVNGIVFGDGPLLNEMQLLANHSRSQVTFAGASEPRSGFASMDISLSWSDSEGMPLAIQEAIWFGVPVVTNRLPGIEACLGRDMTGIVDSPTEAVELITRMQDTQFYREVIDRQQARLKEIARQPTMTDQIMEFVRGVKATDRDLKELKQKWR
jgi:glycosyltransferase involved in cell wall biosynthesis